MRDLYESHGVEKDKELNTQIITVSYRASITDADIKIFNAEKWVEAGKIDKVAEGQVVCLVDKRGEIEIAERFYLVDDASSLC